MEIFEINSIIPAKELTGFNFQFEVEKTTGLKRLSLKQDNTGLTVSSSTFRNIKELKDDQLEFFQLKVEKTFELDQEHVKAFLRDVTRLNIQQIDASKKNRFDFRAAILDEIKATIEANQHIEESKLKQKLPGPISDHIIKYLHCATLDDTLDILIYRDGVYQKGGETYIAGIVQEGLGNYLTSKHVVDETLGQVQRKTYTSRAAFDKEQHIINLKNGLLDITTGIVTPHTPEHLSRIQLPVEYQPDARCPNILKFLCEVMPNDAERLGLLEEAAIVLIKNTKFQKGFMHIGEGANGKSTWFNVLTALFGSVNISAIPIHNFNKDDRFAMADLDGKIANIHADISEEEMEDTSNVKIAITGDGLRVQEKHKPAYTIRPFAKLIFAANRLPTIKDKTKAFLRRWIIHRWKKQFIENADIHLIDKLTTQEELSGLLNILIALVVKLQSKLDLTYSPSIEQIETEWLQNSDLKLKFISDFTSFVPDGYTVKAELIKRYLIWCKQKGYAADSEKTFFECIRDQFPDKCDVKARHRIPPGSKNSKATYIIKGLQLNDTGLKLCRIEGGVLSVSGLTTHTIYSVLFPESNISSEPQHTQHTNTLECESTCKHRKACMKGESCPVLKGSVCSWGNSCAVLWDGSEQNQTNDLGISLLRYLFTSSRIKEKAV